MSSLKRICFFVMAIGSLLSVSYLAIGQNLVTYAGKSSGVKFHAVQQLSDNTYIIGGESNDLNWLPGSVSVTTISLPSIVGGTTPINSAANTVAFMLRVSSDMKTILQVLRMPANSVRNIQKIRLSNVPGQVTKSIYFSGQGINETGSGDLVKRHIYYICKLNGNFVSQPVTGVEFIKQCSGWNPKSRPPELAWPINAEGNSAVKIVQPWDVSNEGRILYVSGQDFSIDYAWMNMTGASGKDSIVNGWIQHIDKSNSGWIGTPSTSYINTSGNPLKDLAFTQNNFKYGNSGAYGSNGSFARSFDISGYNKLGLDENGNGGRKGDRAEDAFFNGFLPLIGTPNTGPGYLGLNISSVASGGGTPRIVAVVFDKRDNSFYVGYSIATKFNGIDVNSGEKDTETILIAFDAEGMQKWWARLHKETSENSYIQQHIDALEIDYKNNKLVVLGRCRGDVTNNFWKGNELVLNPGGNGFQNKLTGTIKSTKTGADFSWLGKYNLSDGKIKFSTYLAEQDATNPAGTASTDPNLDAWSSLNSSNPNLVQTRVSALAVNPLNGEVNILGSTSITDNIPLGTLSRVITSASAYQKMYKPTSISAGGGSGVNTSFVRVYDSTLSNVVYSSLLTGVWNPSDNSGVGNTALTGLFAGSDGPIIVGSKVSSGNEVQTINVTPWGDSLAGSESKALFAHLKINCTAVPAQPSSLSSTATACPIVSRPYTVAAVAGALSYYWVIDGINWTIDSSYTKKLTVNAMLTGPSIGGTLRVYAINGCGVSLARVVSLPSSAAPPETPGAILGGNNICAGENKTFRISVPSRGATAYRWRLSGTFSGWTLSPSTSDSIKISATIGATGSPTLSVSAINACSTPDSSAVPAIIALSLATTPIAPVASTSNPTAQCLNAPLTYQIQSVSNATTYIWSSSTGWSLSNLVTSGLSNSITPFTQVTGNLSVAAQNECGISPLLNINLPLPLDLTVPSATNLDIPNQAYCRSGQATFRATPVTGATGYTWAISGVNPGTFVGNGTTQIVTSDENALVQLPSANGLMNISVAANNICGKGPSKIVSVTVGTIVTPPTIVNEPAIPTLCSGSIYTFSITPTANTNFTKYTWTLPDPSWSFRGANNGNSVSVRVGSATGTGSVVVKIDTSGLGLSCATQVSVTPSNPSTGFTVPTSASVPITVIKPKDTLAHCPGVTLIYVAKSDGSPTKFSWSLPKGWYLQYASAPSAVDPVEFDTVRITATEFAVNDSLRVYRSNTCGYGAYFLKLGAFDEVVTNITGRTDFCQVGRKKVVDTKYFIKKINNASYYSWSISPSNAATNSFSTGTNDADSAVTIKWNPTFSGLVTLKVRVGNKCNFAERTLQIKMFPDSTISAGTGLDKVCKDGELKIGKRLNVFPLGGVWTGPGLRPLDTTFVANNVTGSGPFTLTYSLPSCPGASIPLPITVFEPVRIDTVGKTLGLAACGVNNGTISNAAIRVNAATKLVYTIRSLSPTGSIVKKDSTGSGTATSLSISATGLAPGLYFITAKGAGDCTPTPVAFTIKSSNPPAKPTVLSGSKALCQRDTASLKVQGASIKWYKDSLKTNLVGSSLITTTGAISALRPRSDSALVKTYFVTQNINGCESDVEVLTWTVKSKAVVGSTVTITNDTCGQNKGKISGLVGTLVNGAIGPLVYTWTNASSTVIGDSAGTYSKLSAGTYALKLTTNGDCEINKINLIVANITSPGLPPIITASEDSVCTGGLSSTLTATASSGTGIYTWTDGLGNIIPTTNNAISVSLAGTYFVTGTDPRGCTLATGTSKQIFAAVIPSTPVIIATPAPSFCDSVFLSTTTLYPLATKYKWMLGGSNIANDTTKGLLIKSLISDTFSLTVANSKGCLSNRSNKILTTKLLPPGFASIDTIYEICPGQSVTLSIQTNPNFSYQWKDGTNNLSTIDGKASVSKSGIFQIVIIGTCTTTKNVAVNLKRKCKEIPNVITPNNDGKNDFYDLSESVETQDIELEITNRWGRRVFFSSNYVKEFDGVDLPDGIYFCKIKNSKSGDNIHKGTIQILR